MRTFIEIVDRGSLSAAAIALDRSSPTVVRTLAGLEDALGIRLLRRTTRRLALTDEGRAYLERCRRILADVEEAERLLDGAADEPRGELRVTAPTTFGQRHVTPLVVAFLQRYSQMRIELLLLDRVVNLLEEGVDIAVRIGPLADSSMIAARAGSMRSVVVASPQLLDRIGTPPHPRALAELPCVQFRGAGAGHIWRFRDGARAFGVTVDGVLSVNQATPAVAACAAGLGFGRFLAYQVAPWLDDGRLRVVLEQFEPPPVPVSLVYTDARLMSSRLRLFLDFARERLRAELTGPGAG